MTLPADVTDAINTLPGRLQASARRFFERLLCDHDIPDSVSRSQLARVAACSEFAAGVLLRDWPVVGQRIADFDGPITTDSLERFSDTFAATDRSPDDAKALLRRERNRQLLHIYWRDVCGAASPDETIAALSLVADHLVRAAVDFAGEQIRARYGEVRDRDGGVVRLVVIGMGKLGGGELNFSSDIDIIFAYPRDGSSDGARELAAQPYFDRLSRQVIALLDDVTADGFVYRTDTRLRPFGDSGPPVVSFAALESYLVNHGRDWERYAWVKARLVGPKPPDDVAKDLFDNLINPFVYRRYLDYGVFESLRDMHRMIAAEVQRRDLADNVKLGPGGIREIEFIAQTLQIVRGGSQPELRTPSLLSVLPRLVDAKIFDDADVAALLAAYRFLRKVENTIQAIRDEQTHELPVDDDDRERLCHAIGMNDWPALIAQLAEHRATVSHYFDDVTFRGRDDDSPDFRQTVTKLWVSGSSAEEWRQFLEDNEFARAAELAAMIVDFRDTPATRKIGKAAAERLQTFMPRLLRLSGERTNPARALRRSLSVVERVLRRSAYLALLNENRLAAERLVRLCEKSSYIAAELARFPVLLDELLDPRLLSEPVPKSTLLAELCDSDRGAAADDSEARMERLARFQRGQMFRIAVADFTDALTIMKVSDSLTWLAEAVLEHTLAVAWADIASKHGEPCYEIEGKHCVAGFGIIAYGKLGGLELSYGSDLDIVFLHDSRGKRQETNGAKALDNTVFFQRLVRRMVHFLTTRTTTGELYEIDTRLRPSGRKGLLVTSVEAFERYQAENAWTWEHQALLRARPVAGSELLGAEFRRIRDETLMTRVRLETLREDVLSMRARMRKELDRSDAGTFDLKNGAGGVGDIEFIVQYLVLKSAGKAPDVIEYTDNIRQLDALAGCGVVSAETATALQDIYRGYRRRQHHLVLNDEPMQVADDEFEAERAAVIRTWDEVFGS
ncbi:MAG: bifunctional [glutamate--ammonia ligase]-adenylyl-L-tyrosine phosphorylase/[glutamate--ammonia-ligase] adenylyltransferase [Woeseiaceae bacterium]|nr:bifunctional [glutamate--ammonia ligase]-adenylyl-L-tyrosine phosphorylase/[glutamate--ammonia-ligase] adenylyltransferase [Woeseiaceae bacterium]